jgi:hypothetical protein
MKGRNTPVVKSSVVETEALDLKSDLGVKMMSGRES